MSNQSARVSRVDRGAVDLITDSGELRAEIPFHINDIAVGDWVIVDDASIVEALPRRTSIVRAAASGESRAQTLVANVDVVLLAVPAFPPPKLSIVERLVALAWDSGATPVVLLTKADLAAEPERLVAEVTGAAPGCEVIAVSAETGEGLETVAAHDQPGVTLCLIGRSGAGKSTLTNALVGGETMAVNSVRDDGKGRHTTTHRELIGLPGGGVLIDTPGLRGVGIWIVEDGVAQTFPEIEALVAQCRFADCSHDTEPGCAITAAIADGSLPQRRLDSWRKLEREVAWLESRTDARLRQERSRHWRQISREVRRSGRIRP